jgi:hypothetical protein
MHDRIPTLLARTPDDKLRQLAHTRWVASACHEFVGGVCGVARVEAFASERHGNRGGFVVRMRVDHDGRALLPSVKLLDDGVELHLAGDDEAEALCVALIQVLAQRDVRAALTHSCLHAPAFDDACLEGPNAP